MRPISAAASIPADRLTRFSQLIGRVIPDAMSTAVGMLLLLALAALAIGNSGTAVMDAFYRGLWMLLPFTMQMTLILVLSAVKFFSVVAYYMHLKFDNKLFTGIFVFPALLGVLVIGSMILLFHVLHGGATAIHGDLTPRQEVSAGH